MRYTYNPEINIYTYNTIETGCRNNENIFAGILSGIGNRNCCVEGYFAGMLFTMSYYNYYLTPTNTKTILNDIQLMHTGSIFNS